MNENSTRSERLRCLAMVLGMIVLTALAGCSSHGHYGYGYHAGYGHHAGYSQCAGGAEDAILVLLIYGVASMLHWCFS